jgi:hypothetical protein
MLTYVGVGHEYLGFNRQYLAALISNLNVFYTLLRLAWRRAGGHSVTVTVTLAPMGFTVSFQ